MNTKIENLSDVFDAERAINGNWVSGSVLDHVATSLKNIQMAEKLYEENITYFGKDALYIQGETPMFKKATVIKTKLNEILQNIKNLETQYKIDCWNCRKKQLVQLKQYQENLVSLYRVAYNKCLDKLNNGETINSDKITRDERQGYLYLNQKNKELEQTKTEIAKADVNVYKMSGDIKQTSTINQVTLATTPVGQTGATYAITGQNSAVEVKKPSVVQPKSMKELEEGIRSGNTPANNKVLFENTKITAPNDNQVKLNNLNSTPTAGINNVLKENAVINNEN